MGHFGKSRGEIGDISTDPFDVDVAAWIHSNKGSEMCSIGPRDVRHEHCLWWSLGFSNNKFDNRWASQVVKSEVPQMIFSIASIVVKIWYIFFKTTLTFGNWGCRGSSATLVRHTHTHNTLLSESLPTSLPLILPFPHYYHGNRFRLFQLGSIRTCFQWTHPKRPICSHVTSQVNHCFFFFGFVFEHEIDEKDAEKKQTTPVKQEKWRCHTRAWKATHQDQAVRLHAYKLDGYDKMW